MKERKKNNKKAGKFKPIYKVGLVLMIVLGFAISIVGPINKEILKPGLQVIDEIQDLIDPGYTKSWKLVKEVNLTVLAAEGNPGFNTSGILSVYFHPHQADVGGYMENSSSNLETNCTDANLGYANADDTETDLLHSTYFDVVFRVQGNNTNTKVGGVFYNTNQKILWTCADLGVGADTELLFSTGEAKTTANDTTYTYLYQNFYDTNGGAGFTIGQDDKIEITSIKYYCYF